MGPAAAVHRLAGAPRARRAADCRRVVRRSASTCPVVGGQIGTNVAQVYEVEAERRERAPRPPGTGRRWAGCPHPLHAGAAGRGRRPPDGRAPGATPCSCVCYGLWLLWAAHQTPRVGPVLTTGHVTCRHAGRSRCPVPTATPVSLLRSHAARASQPEPAASGELHPRPAAAAAGRNTQEEPPCPTPPICSRATPRRRREERTRPLPALMLRAPTPGAHRLAAPPQPAPVAAPRAPRGPRAHPARPRPALQQPGPAGDWPPRCSPSSRRWPANSASVASAACARAS